MELACSPRGARFVISFLLRGILSGDLVLLQGAYREYQGRLGPAVAFMQAGCMKS